MGEFELLARIRERLGAGGGDRVRLGSGDDAAITVPGGATATSVDAIVEGVHFRRSAAPGLEWVGRKALATALSDLAAMAAHPGEAYVVLGLPDDVDEGGCLELADGIAELGEETGTAVVGGDLSSSPTLFVAVTVVGHADGPDRLITRAGAEPGDVLVVTGTLGAAAAGLVLLEGAGARTPAELALVERQLRPVPQLAAAEALAAAGARAMIDVSDGLGGDARHLAAASGVGLRIEASSLPVADGVEAVAASTARDPLELVAGGGEDYELLAALPEGAAADAAERVEALGVALTEIGAVVAGEGVEIRLSGGRTAEPAGFEQLRRST